MIISDMLWANVLHIDSSRIFIVFPFTVLKRTYWIVYFLHSSAWRLFINIFRILMMLPLMLPYCLFTSKRFFTTRIRWEINTAPVGSIFKFILCNIIFSELIIICKSLKNWALIRNNLFIINITQPAKGFQLIRRYFLGNSCFTVIYWRFLTL